MGKWRYSSTILDLDSDGGEWSHSPTGHITSGETVSCIHSIGGWVVPGADVSEYRKNLLSLQVIELQSSSPYPESIPIQLLRCSNNQLP
jgi:hypothetical protein